MVKDLNVHELFTQSANLLQLDIAKCIQAKRLHGEDKMRKNKNLTQRFEKINSQFKLWHQYFRVVKILKKLNKLDNMDFTLLSAQSGFFSRNQWDGATISNH